MRLKPAPSREAQWVGMHRVGSRQVGTALIPELEEMSLTALSVFFFHYLFSLILSLKMLVSVKRKWIFYKDQHLQWILPKHLIHMHLHQMNSDFNHKPFLEGCYEVFKLSQVSGCWEHLSLPLCPSLAHGSCSLCA